MPQHVHIEADTAEQIAAAEKVIMLLLNQLATVNGFALKKAEQRCGGCGAIGHRGFECPEIGGQNYDMVGVVCSIWVARGMPCPSARWWRRNTRRKTSTGQPR